jgi:hypothetical protein
VRRLLQSLVVLSVTPVAIALPVLSRPLAKPHPVPPKVSERTVNGVDSVAAQRIPGWGALAGPATARPVALTGQTATKAFEAIGVTWADDGAGEVEALARVRQHGAWSDWHALDGDGEHTPDAASAEARSSKVRGGTEPWFTGPADGYQVRVGAVGGGRPPHDVRVSLVDPGSSAADSGAGAAPTLGSASAEASIGRPAYVTRAQWGADESLRTCCPSYGSTIKMGFVHHTDTSNSYSATQAAAMVRSVYAFHTRSRGWSDIGYNFLVDKYGRVFEGRYGGVDRPVIGAHTGGFNTNTFGVSLLGTYSTVAPTSAELSALERVFAWKLGLHYVNPYGRTTLTSAGGSKYAAGTVVTFDNISGHRDAGLTSCPGNQVYNRLSTIRAAIKSAMGASLYYPGVSTAAPLYRTSTGVTVKATTPVTQAWRLTVRRGSSILRTFTGPSTTSISPTWDLRDGSGALVTPAVYSLTLESWTSATKARPYVANVEVLSPLPDGIATAHDDGNPYGFVEAGSLAGVTPALGRALRPSPALLTYTSSRAHLVPAQAKPRDGLYVASTGGTPYLLVDGARRPVSSSVVSALGLSSPRVIGTAVLTTIPAGPAWTDTARHPDGFVVKTSGGTYWRIESGVRRPFASTAARNRWAKGAVTPLALPGDLALPLGAPLASPEGTLFRTASGVVMVSGGAYRPLADPAALGYDPAQPPVATPDDLAALPLGAPVAATAHPPGALLRNGSGYLEVLGTSRRVVDPTLLAADPRIAVAPESGEVAALSGARYVAPSGLVGRAADGTIRVVESGRLVTLAANVANALGYTAAALPALEAADFGPLPVGAALARTDAHPAGTLVTDGSATWLLDAGVRRPLALSLVATWLGHRALPATAADLALPVGAAAAPGDGAWLATPDGARWLVYAGARRPVSAAVAHRLGLDLVVAQPVVAADLTAATRLGSAVP